MKRILTKTRIPVLLCSAMLASGPALAQGVGVGAGVGAGAPGAGVGTGAQAGAGIGTSPGAGIGTSTAGTLNGNAATNPSIGVPNRVPSASIGTSNNAGIAANPSGMATNGGIAGSSGVSTSTQQTPASRLAEKAKANADAALAQSETSRLLNQSATVNSQGTANGTVPAQ